MSYKDNIDDGNCKLNGCLFFSTTKLARTLGKLADEAFRITGLSPSHAVLLYVINLKREIPQKEAGEILHLTPSTVTRLVDKLERKGYVKKHQEGKNVRLQATSDGLAQQEQIIDSWNQLHSAYQNILTKEETASFLAISGKLLDKISDDSE